MIQIQNSVTRPSSRLDSIMSDLINESEKSLSCQPLNNPYIPTLPIGPKNHAILETKIQFQLKLDQTPRFENHIDILASYPFLEIEIEYESNYEPQVSDSISLFD